jgi:hypothetical protein
MASARSRTASRAPWNFPVIDRRSAVLPVLLVGLLLLPAAAGSVPKVGVRSPAVPSQAHPSIRPAVNLTGSWSELRLVNGQAPSVRDMASMAYDPSLGAVVLFGGYSPFVYPYGDTWIFSHGNWTDLSASVGTGPAPRWGARMIWDPAISELLLFGGRNLTQFFNDTWAFNGTAWSQFATPQAPSPRAFYQMAYDAQDGYVFLYGGGIGNLPNRSAWTLYSDSWSFAGGVWTNLTANTAGSPGVRESGGMSYDPGTGQVLLFGGNSVGFSQGQCTPVGTTYGYQNGTWTDLTSSAGGPMPAVASLSFTYDGSLGGTVAFGGLVQNGSAPCVGTNDTYVNVGGVWTNLTTAVAPQDRSEAPMAADPALGGTVLFGGSYQTVVDPDSYTNYGNDTWLFRAFVSNGTGSGGSSGNGSGGTGGNGTSGGTGNGSGSSGSPFLNVVTKESVAQGTSPLSVAFSAVPTTGVAPYRYVWNFGDGTYGPGPSATDHVYTQSGSFAVEVTVTDGSNAVAVEHLPTVVVGPAPGLPTTSASGSPASPLAGVGLELLAAGLIVGLLGSVGLVAIWQRRREQDEAAELLGDLREHGEEPAPEPYLPS